LIGRGVVETDTSHNHLCEGDSSGGALEMHTDSEALLRAGIAVAKRAWDKFSLHTGWTPETPELIITHQVGRAHTKAVFESIGLDPEKNYSSFETLGNCGSVSLPITYSLAHEAGKVTSGCSTAFLGIGSGLSCIIHSVTN
jgi:3-oxoacyl-[acyl-carrier-protein] synthase-3